MRLEIAERTRHTVSIQQLQREGVESQDLTPERTLALLLGSCEACCHYSNGAVNSSYWKDTTLHRDPMLGLQVPQPSKWIMRYPHLSPSQETSLWPTW